MKYSFSRKDRMIGVLTHGDLHELLIIPSVSLNNTEQ